MNELQKRIMLASFNDELEKIASSQARQHDAFMYELEKIADARGMSEMEKEAFLKSLGATAGAAWGGVKSALGFGGKIAKNPMAGRVAKKGSQLGRVGRAGGSSGSIIKARPPVSQPKPRTDYTGSPIQRPGGFKRMSQNRVSSGSL
jgi:hypothetical protein